MEMDSDKKISLFASCIPVKGAMRSLVCDLQRNSYEFIPNELYDILIKYNGRKLYELYEEYTDFKDIIDEYLFFLKEKEYIFYTSDYELYPKMDLHWDQPSKIINAIIDFSSKSLYNFEVLIRQLDELGCMFIQFKVYDLVDLAEIKKFILLTKKSRIRGIELILPNSIISNREELLELINLNGRLLKIILHSALNDEVIILKSKIKAIYMKQEISSSDHCGFIHPADFVVDMDVFTEGLNHNSCLNKKISIDENGNIKNCPSMKTSFGQIGHIKLIDVINNENFNKLWNITKDQTNICKDCEFRYICTDCRAFIEDQDNIYSKPLKCNYDPYTTTWKN
ncbi:MAG: grasp-with-spasm system SPASM domain peptide maturase [Bacteroidota bacterium]